MTANLLTLNSSKTEFLLTALKQQTVHLTQLTLLVTLASFLMNASLFLTRYQLCLNPATHISVNCIWPYLDHKTASTIATSIVHSKLDYCNSLYYNLSNTQLNRLQHIQNSLARAVVRAPKSSHINLLSNLYTGLKLSSA